MRPRRLGQRIGRWRRRSSGRRRFEVRDVVECRPNFLVGPAATRDFFEERLRVLRAAHPQQHECLAALGVDVCRLFLQDRVVARQAVGVRTLPGEQLRHRQPRFKIARRVI